MPLAVTLNRSCNRFFIGVFLQGRIRIVSTDNSVYGILVALVFQRLAHDRNRTPRFCKRHELRILGENGSSTNGYEFRPLLPTEVGAKGFKEVREGFHQGNSSKEVSSGKGIHLYTFLNKTRPNVISGSFPTIIVGVFARGGGGVSLKNHS